LDDHTVRTRDHITGLKSGLGVAGKEIIFGAYDAITGLATHPYNGWVKGHGCDGGPVWGATKGIGRGLGGVLCRSGAIAFAIPGHALKGLEQEILQWGKNKDCLPGLANDQIDTIRARVASKQPRQQRQAIQEQWLRLANGQPILQRRILQCFFDLENMLENNMQMEAVILQRWDTLVASDPR
jgi:hypothetical protein